MPDTFNSSHFGGLHLSRPLDAATRGRRDSDLAAQREAYRWRIEPGLPSSMVGMPKQEAFSRRKQARVAMGFARAAAHIAAVTPRILRSRWRSLSVFDDFVPLGPAPSTRKVWRNDREFARQRLTGVNPGLIELCTRLPPNFGLDPSLLDELLGPGIRLEQELAERRMFLCDYAVLDGVTCVEGRHLVAPLVLLHQPRGGQLTPLAIQLGQDPSDALVFTPLDAPLDWLAARMFAQSADGHHHQFVSHLLRCHYQLEPFVIAARRQLHPCHPLAELLEPHFRWLFAINAVARSQAANDRGSFGRMKSTGMIGGYEIMRRAHRVPFLEGSLPRDLRRRGLESSGVLADYWYRDDAIELHAAITRYVHEIIQQIYPEAQMLREDVELRGWITELADPQRGRVQELADGSVLEEPARLEELCVELIFRVTVWHNAVSHGQFDNYAQITNMPHGAIKAPPKTRGVVDEAYLSGMISRRHAIDQVAAAYAAGTSPVYTLLDPKPGQWDGAPAGLAAREAFGRELLDISARIQARNARLEHPYESLDPRHIAQGVTV